MTQETRMFFFNIKENRGKACIEEIRNELIVEKINSSGDEEMCGNK